MSKVTLIGTSQMAVDYTNVLKALNIPFVVVGRGESSAEAFFEKTGVRAVVGGVEKYLESKPTLDKVILSTDIMNLGDHASLILNYGCKDLLIEKPGALTVEKLKQVESCSSSKNIPVFIAYNRRFYTSVSKTEEMIKEDGGLLSFQFEFTEWDHILSKLDKPVEVKNKWFWCNSTHVVDLAFYFGGIPVTLSSYHSGELSWHKPAIFSGAGVTKKNIPFSYHANWMSAGRWVLELFTPKRRIILKPLEKLFQQMNGSVVVEEVRLEDEIDKEFKPGLYQQVNAYLNNNRIGMCSIGEHVNRADIYFQIAGYK